MKSLRRFQVGEGIVKNLRGGGGGVQKMTQNGLRSLWTSPYFLHDWWRTEPFSNSPNTCARLITVGHHDKHND